MTCWAVKGRTRCDRQRLHVRPLRGSPDEVRGTQSLEEDFLCLAAGAGRSERPCSRMRSEAEPVTNA